MDFSKLASLFGGGGGAAAGAAPGGMAAGMQGGAGFGLGQPLVQGAMGQTQMAGGGQQPGPMGGFAQMLQGLGGGGTGDQQGDPHMMQNMLMLQQMMQQQQQPQGQQMMQMPMNMMGSNGRQPARSTGSNMGYLAQGGGVANRRIVGKNY